MQKITGIYLQQEQKTCTNTTLIVSTIVAIIILVISNIGTFFVSPLFACSTLDPVLASRISAHQALPNKSLVHALFKLLSLLFWLCKCSNRFGGTDTFELFTPLRLFLCGDSVRIIAPDVFRRLPPALPDLIFFKSGLMSCMVSCFFCKLVTG